MKRIIAMLIICIVVTPVPVLCKTITCDRFDPKVNRQGSKLLISLDTDLPDYTQLMISVSRSYQTKGTGSKYSIDYSSSSDIVGNWRKEHTVDIDHGIWHKLLKERLKVLAAIGEPDKVHKIDDEITVSFVVPINQSDPRFGKGNSNLVGKKVKTNGLRVVQSDVKIKYSIGSGAKDIQPTFNNPDNLRSGHIYKLSEETPLAPERHPTDPLKAASLIKRLPAGTIIKVLVVDRSSKSNPWYQVLATSPSGVNIGKGWINSRALIGQEIMSVRP